MQGVEHGTTRHMVEGTNGVNRENCCSGARLGGRTKLTASVPTLVLRPYWYIGHTGCLKVRREVLRQDPPSLRRATRRPTRRPSSTTGGTVALASRLAAPYSKRRCSLVAPEGPAADSPGTPEAIEKRRRREGAPLVGSAVQRGISKGRVGHGRSPRRVAKFGKGVGVAGRERLSSERASCRRKLPEVDERSRAAGPSRPETARRADRARLAGCATRWPTDKAACGAQG